MLAYICKCGEPNTIFLKCKNVSNEWASRELIKDKCHKCGAINELSADLSAIPIESTYVDLDTERKVKSLIESKLDD